MSFLVFATPSDRTGDTIIQAIKKQLSDENVDFCATVNSLAVKLSKNRKGDEAAILIPTNEEELIDIFSMKRLFNLVPVVLVLPNRDRFVEAMGYRMKPLLMLYRDTSMEEVSTVRNIVKSLHEATSHRMTHVLH